LLPDARIGIGIGTANYQLERVIESDGEAFRFSGSLIDKMKKNRIGLAIKTPWKEVNEELEISFQLLDSLINKWSSPSAEVVHYCLLLGLTQQELSNKLKVSQPAIHKRLALASFDVVQSAINRFEKLIVNQI
jgi:hypothetical protein